MKCPICKNELEIKNKKVGETANGDSIFNEFAICHNCKKQWNLDKQRAKKATEAKVSEPETTTEAPIVKKVEDTAKEETKKVITKEMNTKQEVPPSEQPKKKRKKRPASMESSVETPVKPSAEVSEGEQPRPKKKKKRPVAETTKVTTEATRPVKVKKAAHAMDEPIDEFADKPDVERPKKKKRKPIDNVKKEEPTFSNIPPKHIREEREKEMRQNYQMMLDEGEEDDNGLPTVLIVLLILILLAAAAFVGYWFFIR